jgi:hypothetical protein
MKNVTITLDERVARWARLRAAELNTSVSRLVGQMLGDMMKQERGYDRARRTYLEADAKAISKTGERYPTRNELHDRDRLR